MGALISSASSDFPRAVPLTRSVDLREELRAQKANTVCPIALGSCLLPIPLFLRVLPLYI
jgi:hypothetical protein